MPAEVEERGPSWQFPGHGDDVQQLHAPDVELRAITAERRKPRPQLSQWPATAIAGNDLLSSVLYAAALVAAKAGKLMPVPFLLVGLVLYFFRAVYSEVVAAFPLNGGSYNALLNTTSKRTAAVAAALSVLSYTATAVVSATTGVKYFAVQIDIPVVESTVALLFVFAVIAGLGITESSRVASVIFFHNALVLSVVAVACAAHWVAHPEIFAANMRTDFPAVDVSGSMLDGNVLTAVFFGFGASMLGVTGFETSANFVEEQAPGVFPKTMRNMWALSTAFNVVLSVLIMAVLPLEGESTIASNADALLAQVALVAAGKWLQTWVSVNALVVLAGAVLTSYVGVTGLARRLANDRVLPVFLAARNDCRDTNHFIILLFFLLSASLVVALDADSRVLGGVFTCAFLSLMLLFSCGCMLLKAKRADIPVPANTRSSWRALVFGFVMVLIAALANLLGDPTILAFFALYFLAIATAMFTMLERVFILRAALALLRPVLPSRHGKHQQHRNDERRRLNHQHSYVVRVDDDDRIGVRASVSTSAAAATAAEAATSTPATIKFAHTGVRGGRTITSAIAAIHDAPILFFCKTPDLTALNKAVLYVRRNENTHSLRVVHVYAEDDLASYTHPPPVGALEQFENMVALLDCMYPKLRVGFVAVAVGTASSAAITPRSDNRSVTFGDSTIVNARGTGDPASVDSSGDSSCAIDVRRRGRGGSDSGGDVDVRGDEGNGTRDNNTGDMSATGVFDSAVVEWVARSLRVPLNMVFIKQPSRASSHEVVARGVRIITA